MTKTVLPYRRGGLSFELTFPPKTESRYHITIGKDASGNLAEIFVHPVGFGWAGHINEEKTSMCAGWAMATSLALQHGVPLKKLRAKVNRGRDGSPHCLYGAILDAAADV